MCSSQPVIHHCHAKDVVIREAQAIAPEIADASKAPFVPQRLVATMDRTLRICFRLTTALEAAYAGVPKLGKAQGEVLP